MSTHQCQLIATGLLLEFKLANCKQWGNVTAGDYALPISFASNYSVVANDVGDATASIKIQKKTNSIVNFYGRDYNGVNYNTPTVIFIAVGV